MANHSLASIEKLEKQLQERHEKLVAAMRGREVSETDMRTLHFPHRWVNSSDIRVAVEDFGVILKEIKASLGKR